MKLTLPRKDLLTALNAVKPVAGGALPILNQLLIVAHEKSVTCTATNLDLSASG
jgi:DNA polymerase III sliding clamp (beta) subunit (PCNA family)